MAYLSFADLIAGPSALSPTEAAALTLAVARRLEEERASGNEMPIPDDHGILLSSTGTVAFVRGSDAAVSDEPAGLSALLMRLLRLEKDGPRAHVPGGLLIVLARNLGYIQLPPTSADAFRTALERFATADPTLLAGIFWRAARPKGAQSRQDPAGAGDRSRPQVDRRRRGASASDLRRALRELDFELFQLRGRLARATGRPSLARASLPLDLSKSGALRWVGVAAAALLIASIAAGSGARGGAVEPEGSATGVSPGTDGAAESLMPTIEGRLLGEPDAVAAVASVPEPEPEPQNEAASRPALKRAASRPSGAVRPSRRVQHRPVPLPPAHPARVFAGGARAIAWAH